MVDFRHHAPADEALDERAMALFQRSWETYRKVVDNGLSLPRWRGRVRKVGHAASAICS